jgi:hypothetical protein
MRLLVRFQLAPHELAWSEDLRGHDTRPRRLLKVIAWACVGWHLFARGTWP